MNQRITVRAKKGGIKSDYGFNSRITGESRIVLEGDFEFEVEDLGTYVQVQTQGFSRLTYSDPSARLVVGDFVMVPFGWTNKPVVAEVVELGRGTYTGPTKAVKSRLVSEAL